MLVLIGLYSLVAPRGLSPRLQGYQYLCEFMGGYRVQWHSVPLSKHRGGICLAH